MLFTDIEPVTSADIYAMDAQAADIAASESITVDGPMSVCQRARDYCSTKLLGRLKTFESWPNQDMFPVAMLQTIYSQSPIGSESRPKISTAQMVLIDDVNQWSNLKQWLVAEAAVRLYQAAVGNNLQDQFKAKLLMYTNDIRKQYWPAMQHLGIPVVMGPLARPAAKYERNSGTWGSANVVAVSGALTGSYDVAITYVDQSIYVSYLNPKNAESGPTDTLTIALATQSIQLVFTSLVPPNGAAPLEWLGVYKPLTATGINIYAAVSGQPLRLQNSVPLPIATTSFTFSPSAGLAPAGTGQHRNIYQSFGNMIDVI